MQIKLGLRFLHLRAIVATIITIEINDLKNQVTESKGELMDVSIPSTPHKSPDRSTLKHALDKPTLGNQPYTGEFSQLSLLKLINKDSWSDTNDEKPLKDLIGCDD